MIAAYRYKRNPEFRDSERKAYLKDREYWDSYQGNDYVDKVRADIIESEQQKDRFGHGTDQRQIIEASVKLINEFMPEIDKELRKAFVEGDLQTKAQLLQEHANDTDDRLWRSNEWMFLEQALGK
jgi:hypothetical protein|tara:strand:- start:3996 stop:4370 length:375 start_codon:yes stop_codon:yes gene_type:complete